MTKIGWGKNHPLMLSLGRNFDDERNICMVFVSSHMLLISGEKENLV